MSDKNETVIIEMVTDARLRLYGQITARMEKLGYNPSDYGSLNLGFDLPPAWPADRDSEITMAQLIVLAHKLRMRLIIDNLNLVPRE